SLSEVIRDVGVKQIYGSENIEYKLYEQYITEHVPLFLRMPFRHQAKKIKQEELEAAAIADACLSVTEDEGEVFSKVNKNIYTVPNGVDLNYFHFTPKEPSDEKTLLFIGNFSYFPNVQ